MTSRNRFAAILGPGWLAAAVLAGLATMPRAAAQQPGQQTFKTAPAAALALQSALRAGSRSALLAIFGPSGAPLAYSGDSAQDKADQGRFVQAYATMHRLVSEPDGEVVLYVGAENWPFPVPLTQGRAGWYFDTDAGLREVVYRRIGHNEDETISILRQLVMAEREYYNQAHDGAAAHRYADHFISDPGKHNGLFWDDPGGASSPIGPLLAFASVEAQAKAVKTPAPFQGYYFHLLKAQGKNAPGGARNYIVNGAMTAGFAFVAWPADYRSSGVFTFLVGPDGAVYQKNLGPDSAALARAMSSFDPDPSWTRLN